MSQLVSSFRPGPLIWDRAPEGSPIAIVKGNQDAHDAEINECIQIGPSFGGGKGGGEVETIQALLRAGLRKDKETLHN